MVLTKATFLDKRRGLKTIIDSNGSNCDMKKRVLRAITLEEGPHVIYNTSCIGNLPQSNSTYIEITNCIYGWMVDFFLVLEKHCNFKLQVFESKTILAIATLPTFLSALHDVFVFDKTPLSFKGMARKFVASFAYYFGGNFLDRRHRLLILICHLSYGMIIWIFFRGSLTSKLTERAYNYPFVSLEELSRTNYRLLTARKDTKVANHFLNAIQNSSREKVWLNNMNHNSFIGLKIAAENIFEDSTTALYYYEMEGSYHLAMHNKYCKSLIPWKNDKKLLYSVSVNKNFSYFNSINMLAKRMRQSGMVQKFLFQHGIVPDSCQEEKNVEIGYEKVFSLFLILIAAMIISILYMLIIELKY